ncbi:chloramphenicol phosphotransferase CPT family protein [Ensifer adhaerens]|uniref:chloramphenicol phosphotransferase CPT family protein n=1 Tax=Ensifer adhaerens TaxID=106592 RepID=UPI003CD02FAE
MQHGRIIFLNGTSSAGKSTLAKALREILPEPFCYYASDQLADAGFRVLKRGMHHGMRGERARFFDGFHRSIAAFAEAGNDLIVEHIVEEQIWAEDLRMRTAHLDVFWVGIHAPIEELERRERERGDRTVGEARFHLKTHDHCTYDFEVDTRDPTDQVAARIVDHWLKRQSLRA